MKTNFSLLILACVFGLVSCEKDIPYKGEAGEPRLVLNGIMELDSTFKVKLERSVFFLDNSSQSEHIITSNATIIVKNLTTNDTYTVIQPALSGLYEFPFAVTANTHYSIEASHPNYETISSELKTLSGVNIISLDTSSVMEEENNILKFELVWNDNSSEENFYFIQVVQTQNWDGFEYTYPVSLSSLDLAIDQSQSADGSVEQSEYLLVSDLSFNGNQKTLKFECYNPFYWGSEGISLRVELVSMSKEVYMYRKSMSLYLEQDFFSEPVKVFSNILNGFGIFGFTSRDFRVI